MGTSKLGGLWDPGGQLLVVPSPISVNLHAASPEGSMACTRSKRLPPKGTAIGIEQDENDIGVHLDLIQVHLDNGCYRDKYHGESNMLKDLQAPWDPGELCMTAAWGQAESQGVGDVSDPITTASANPPIDRHMGRAWLVATPREADYKYSREREKGYPRRIRHGTAAPPLPSPTHCSSFFLLPPPSIHLYPS